MRPLCPLYAVLVLILGQPLLAQEKEEPKIEKDSAVSKGLKWLALHQAPDGRWSLDQFHLHARDNLQSTKYFNDRSTGQGQKNDTAATAFGVRPFLAAGITHKPSGMAEQDVYVKTVQRGLNFLIRTQNKDGSFPGGMYAHGIASITMCEAYGLTADPALKRSAQAALNYIIQAQEPTSGGWRYMPRQGGDTSVLGWQVQALKSGQLAGLNVPNATLKKAGKWLDSCETRDGGGYGYVSPQETPTMTASALLCRLLLGTPPRDARLLNGVDKLKKNIPPGSQRNIYCDYYATQVFHQIGGDSWDFWNKGADQKKGMRDILIDRQDKDGSWDPKGDTQGGTGGRIMHTSLSLLTLEVPYRHEPLFQRVK